MYNFNSVRYQFPEILTGADMKIGNKNSQDTLARCIGRSIVHHGVEETRRGSQCRDDTTPFSFKGVLRGVERSNGGIVLKLEDVCRLSEGSWEPQEGTETIILSDRVDFEVCDNGEVFIYHASNHGLRVHIAPLVPRREEPLSVVAEDMCVSFAHG